ncbi:MAG: 4-(cytidine 5'-diphospho)-2-C-methyl-D-erythritol kinase [Acidimicrobiia bacterium]|nr:4-(cytidine 5'-diphospho)-2-C-methyl-D-erythritol kinase [Acidimicrobiia bacterium]
MSEQITARAPAKVNLSLRVAALDASGLHPMRSLAQSVGWYDRVIAEASDEDELEIFGADLSPDGDNLIWRAISAIRARAETRQPVHVRLVKRIPVAAGLGGGSSDAAAALIVYAELTRHRGDLLDVTADLGSDVPFCLSGGTQWVEGHGEVLTPIAHTADDYWMVFAVPAFELSTAAVYSAWDRLQEPAGPELSLRAIPPSIRNLGPFVNDLYPAAVRCNPEVADWRDELSRVWERPVAMSGSGPTLFGFFADEEEASEALGLVPGEARAAVSAPPISRGAHLEGR